MKALTKYFLLALVGPFLAMTYSWLWAFLVIVGIWGIWGLVGYWADASTSTSPTMTKYFVMAAVGPFLAMAYSWLWAFLVTAGIWALLGGYNTIYLAYHTLQRDCQTGWRFGKLLYTNFKDKFANRSVVDKFELTVARHPDKVMMVVCSDTDGHSSLTFQQVLSTSRRIARYFQGKGYKKGEVVALLLENRVDYPAYWIGLATIGVVPALINCNLREKSLLHSITIVKSKAVITSKHLQQAVNDISSGLDGVELYNADDITSSGWTNLSAATSTVSTAALPEKLVAYNDDLFYVYTSGTTGLPKAAVIKHSRFMFACYALYNLCQVHSDDILYSPLPMYHTAGGVGSLGAAILEGCRYVTRKKFSATRFWKDCRNQRVTIAQYIGEIARYLYASSHTKDERDHELRMMFGNGMRPDIWQKFTDRFGIKQICEFYGSTEGNCSVGNICYPYGRVGAVGFVSLLFPGVLPLGLVRVDEETMEPVRDAEGMCVPCKPGQPGELVGRIDRGHPVRDFHGYADKKATGAKVITDVWNRGDVCFRSGDILVMDEFGWLYFKDRAGDTFRWKGENVSTCEVEAVISGCLGLKTVVVYGVQIPGTEGRAGMAALPDVNNKIDVADDGTKDEDKKEGGGSVGNNVADDGSKDGNKDNGNGDVDDTPDIQKEDGIREVDVSGSGNTLDTLDIERTAYLKKLFDGISKDLPSYARPIFIRLVDHIDTTSTHKLKKGDLQWDGFNPSTIKDSIFFLDCKSETYRKMDLDQYTNICNGNIRF